MIISYPFTAISLKGSATKQEDAFYVDPQRGGFILVDAAGGNEDAGSALARIIISSFVEAHRKKIALLDWIEQIHRREWLRMQKLPVAERACASLLAVRQRDGQAAEVISIGKIALWKTNSVSFDRLVFSDFAFPLQALGAGERIFPAWRGIHFKSGEWLVAASGGFLREEHWSDMAGLRDYLMSQDVASPQFRSSAERYLGEKMFSPEDNSSLLCLGAPPILP